MTGVAGVHCALFALFNVSEPPDRAAMKAQVDYVRAAGADGVNMLGLATEVDKLTLVERCQMIDWAAENVCQP